MDIQEYQFCASCTHFMAVKTDGKMKYLCSRLGYETAPKYKFNCWNPKEQVKKLMSRNEKTS